jgi:hypothetical protein
MGLLLDHKLMGKEMHKDNYVVQFCIVLKVKRIGNDTVLMGTALFQILVLYFSIPLVIQAAVLSSFK